MQSYMHMRCQARQLDSYSSARHCSTARQLDSYSTARQTSTDLDAQAHATWSQLHGVRLDRLDRLDRNSTGSTGKRKASTVPRQRLDGASTARQLDTFVESARPRAQVELEEATVLGGRTYGAINGDF